LSEPTNGTARSRDRASVAVVAATVRRLPVLPASIHDLLALDLSDENQDDRVREIIERDAALAAHVLRLANSAAFRGQSDVETLAAAVQRVGAAMIVGNALQSAMHSVFDPHAGMGRALGRIAVLEANIMAALAAAWSPTLRIRPEVAYLHGLLHDIGHLVMALKLGKDFEAFGHRRIPADRIAGRETEAFGFDHQQAGRVLANHWKLPDELTVVIASHHFPRELRHGQHAATNTILDLLALTDRLGRLVEDDGDSRATPEGAVLAWLTTPEAQDLLEPLGCSHSDVPSVVAAALVRVERERRLSAGADSPGPS
jgi:HD-like signal output (HDOD) protein